MAGSKQKRNVALLLFLSDYKAGSRQEDYYEDIDKKPVSSGTQTNDAPVKYLLETALKNDQLRPDRKLSVLCITSNQVMTDKVKEDENGETKEFTMWERFQDYFTDYMINDLGCEQGSFEFVSIPYDYDGEKKAKLSETTNQIAQRIFGEISGRLEENNISDVYVDYTGGMRDIAFLMTTIIRYLEFNGINCQKVVYSQYARAESIKNRIFDITYIYEMFQMINGVNEFVTTGNVTTLSEVFESEDQTDKPVKDLLNSIGDFANAMSICDVSKIDKKLENVNTSISTVLESPGNNVKTAMLKELLPLMKEKMYLDDLGKKDYYIKLINWCEENNMLQQALTLIEDKMPEIYIDKKGSPSCINKVLSYVIVDTEDGTEEDYLNVVGPRYETNEKRKIFYYTTRDRNTKWELSDSGLEELKEEEKDEINEIINEREKTDSDSTESNEATLNSDSEKNRKTILEIRAEECQAQDEELFIKAYCKFRRLEDISSRDNCEYYKSDYGSILKWCKELGKYKFSQKDKAGNTIRVRLPIELHSKIKNSHGEINQDYLETTLLLHAALKKERNCCNHASEKGVRLPVEVVKRAIKIYVQRVEKVLEFINA